MKPIKFRCWDLTKNKYSKFIKYCKFSLKETSAIEKQDDYIIEQFTGLFDKNGEDIYEGDIIYVRDKRTDPVADKIRREVFYQEGCFWIEDHPLSEVYAYCEVIGNIHENPDLLSIA